MHINFNIQHQTAFGQEMVLNIVDADGHIAKYRLTSNDQQNWSHSINCQEPPGLLDYFYSIEQQQCEQEREWTTLRHHVELSVTHGRNYTIYNQWYELPQDSYRYSSAFTDCIDHQTAREMAPSHNRRTVRLVVRASQLRDGQRLGIVGRGRMLGHWDTAHTLPLTQHQTGEWAIDLDAQTIAGGQLEFKFVVLAMGQVPMWEDGLNRTIQLPMLADGDVVVYELRQAFFAIPNEKVAGTLVPVFSLRTQGSFGIGDFGDLRRMVDFLHVTGQRVLQLLPVNDTTATHTWADCYPYSAISIFALHPIYADLRQLPPLRDALMASDMARQQNQLNALPKIDFERVAHAKWTYLKALFQQEGLNDIKTDAFKTFFRKNERWLVPYAHYCTLRDQYGTADFTQWPSNQQWNEADRGKLTNPHNKICREAALHYWVQFVLNRQLSDAHDYARQKGVVLKGDIPIGVNRHGCDVWTEPRYFNLNGQAGAPPDDFSLNGQNWGFPTYNWDAMLEDGCAWWEHRFQNMAQYFDAYRIDHVLGFFRIWQIPIDSVHGLLGQFVPSQGFTCQEIKSYGLHFNEDHCTRPFIAEWVLDRLFAERKEEVKANYLVHLHDDIYALRPEYDTQRKVQKLIVEDEQLRDGLYTLISDVLFVRDHKDPNLFHPRIAAHSSFVYEALWDDDKAAFNRLYDHYFYGRNNQFWYAEAMKKLPRLVQTTRMLVCAEDLGMVPACVPWVMDELRILSLEVQSMPKEPYVRFGSPAAFPYRSVCTFSSHDMPTLRQWWDEDPARTQDFYSNKLHQGDAAPHPLPGWLAREIVASQLTSGSMLCVLSIQDWMAIDENLRLPDANAERINIPANPHHYWRYRMHVNIEDLLRNHGFVQNVKQLVSLR